MFRLYLITDRRLAPDLPRAVDRALSCIPAGSAAVQLREKDLSARGLLHLAREVGAVCRRRAAPLLVSDRIDVALAADADGVHITGDSVPVEEARLLLGRERLVGVSCHDRGELTSCEQADFALFSPIFPSPGKGPPVGLPALRQASEARLPLFALGGVDVGNAADCVAAGASGVAAIRAWLAADDPAQATRSLLRAVERGNSQGPRHSPVTRPRRLW